MTSKSYDDVVATDSSVVGNIKRNYFLDFLKGLAILTVVAGHTFQGGRSDFDDYWPFRFIYSFHMPMFMFVSGMTAAFVFNKYLLVSSGIGRFAFDIPAKLARLVVPFFTWAAFSWWYYKDGSFLAHMLKVIQAPDNGLWFLVVLFECSVALSIMGILTAGFCQLVRHFIKDQSFLRNIMLGTLALLSILIYNIFQSLPDFFGLYLAKMYLPYVILGLLYNLSLPRGLPTSARYLPYVVFIILVPFWHRTNISYLIGGLPQFAHPRSMNAYYMAVVALSGTLAFVDSARSVYQILPKSLRLVFIVLGTRSLDIYAIHFYLLWLSPPIFAPVVDSLIISLLLRSTAFTSFIFFGQYKSWMPIRMNSSYTFLCTYIKLKIQLLRDASTSIRARTPSLN